jgi:hypothetical protein
VALIHPVVLSTDSAQAVEVPTSVLEGAEVALPPVEASYHTTEDPEGGVAVPVCCVPV